MDRSDPAIATQARMAHRSMASASSAVATATIDRMADRKALGEGHGGAVPLQQTSTRSTGAIQDRGQAISRPTRFL